MTLNKMHFESYDIYEVMTCAAKWTAKNKRRVRIHDVIIRPFIVDGDEIWFIEVYYFETKGGEDA